jgi:Zn-dependent M28 family amino/carboxypeptidase
MKRNAVGQLIGIILGVSCLALAFPLGQTPPPDAAVTQMVAEVAKDRLAETVTAFASIGSRFSPTTGCRTAGTSIYNFLSRLGLVAEYETFRYNSPLVAGGGMGRNVVAAVSGTTFPERAVIVGAHYDSFSNELRIAPGADDNASGTAALLEIARVLSRHRFPVTIKFIAFDAEELGTHGSEHAAAVARNRRDVVVAMLNLDMVAFTDAGTRALAVVPDRGSQWLADRFIETASRYASQLRVVKRVNVKWARSDQMSFWEAGYAALGISEDDPNRNPHYHHTSDTPDTLDLEFLTAVTRATLATLAGLALVPADGQVGR